MLEGRNARCLTIDLSGAEAEKLKKVPYIFRNCYGFILDEK